MPPDKLFTGRGSGKAREVQALPYWISAMDEILRLAVNKRALERAL